MASGAAGWGLRLAISVSLVLCVTSRFQCPPHDGVNDCDRALALLDEGNTHFQVKEDRQARALYEAALALEPALSDAYLNLGCLSIKDGDGDRAIGLLEKAIELAGTDAVVAAAAYSNIGMLVRESNR